MELAPSAPLENEKGGNQNEIEISFIFPGGGGAGHPTTPKKPLPPPTPTPTHPPHTHTDAAPLLAAREDLGGRGGGGGGGGGEGGYNLLGFLVFSISFLDLFLEIAPLQANPEFLNLLRNERVPCVIHKCRAIGMSRGSERLQKRRALSCPSDRQRMRPSPLDAKIDAEAAGVQLATLVADLWS